MSTFAYWVDCQPSEGLKYAVGPLSSYDQANSEKELLEEKDPSGTYEIRGEPSIEPEAFL